MNKRPFLLIALLVLGFLTIKNTPVQANPEQVMLSGLAKVVENTSPGKCITPDRLRICRGRALVIRVETNDPRLTGETSLVFDSIYTQAPYKGRIKGEFRLDNHGGSWVGTWKGSTDVKGYTLFTAVGQGKGGYEGLVVRWQIERTNSNWLEPMSVSGTISTGRSSTHRR